ncbi:hypothetical protein [Azospirillum rugosum]|uniref:Uncharacterized protein n=1 Tax=Azospirillum rugosum TaxID=416170 RepID=A0ABS4SRU3_9PROT|nr:hypothetical protein [Azospirillum rugosum]MBP2295167.1 hypothetical protein [Azospirillum rugosum]MDQ0528541.1 hypothetical protein [Azospirillum rugosum]
MRAIELGIYNPSQDKLVNRHDDDTRKPRKTLRDLNRENQIRQARDLQRRREEETIALIFGDPEVEREELDLRKARAEIRKTEFEAEQARLEIEQIRAETVATMAAAQKARADAKLAAAKAWNG